MRRQLPEIETWPLTEYGSMLKLEHMVSRLAIRSTTGAKIFTDSRVCVHLELCRGIVGFNLNVHCEVPNMIRNMESLTAIDECFKELLDGLHTCEIFPIFIPTFHSF